MTKFDIIIFTNAPHAYAPKRLKEEAQKLNLYIKVINYQDIGVDINNFSFPDSKAIFIRGMGEDVSYLPLKYFIINYYRKTAKILNLNSFDKWLSLDKITQHFEYKKAGIPIAASYVFGSSEVAVKTLSLKKFPLIAKHNTGSRGVSVYKLRSIDDIIKVTAKHDIKTVLFQDFITRGSDLRIIILNGKILGAMKRIAGDGSYLTNYSQGGRIEKYKIEGDGEAKKIALMVTKHFNLDYCGVDLMKNEKGDWVVLEVNRGCQFEGFEKSTGINVAAKIVEYMAS